MRTARAPFLRYAARRPPTRFIKKTTTAIGPPPMCMEAESQIASIVQSRASEFHGTRFDQIWSKENSAFSDCAIGSTLLPSCLCIDGAVMRKLGISRKGI